MLKRRALLVGLGLGLVGAAFPSRAQQGKVARIGILTSRVQSTPASPDHLFEAFLQAMRGLGHVEGKNLSVEWRGADGNFDRFPALAAELVALKVDVLITNTTPGTRALRQATSTIPIVMTSIIDPVGSGFATSLGRPGGNITGLSVIAIDLGTKYIELLKTALPKLSRVAVFVNPGTSSHAAVFKSIEAAAQGVGISAVAIEARTPEEVERGFVTIAKERAGATIIATDGLFFTQRRQFAELALAHRVPSIANWPEYVAAGGLISYGTNNADLFRRVAVYVDKLLKGAKAAELPIEQPTTLHLAINRITANALGLGIPPELRLRADEVIE